MNKEERDRYLRWGRTVAKRVKTTCVIGASNRQDDITRTSGWSERCVRNMRNTSTSDSASSWAQLIRMLASDARQHRCGNCGEQAALAFEYLRDLQATPIEYVILETKRPGGSGVGVCDGDHVFVVIGRQTGDPIGTDTAGVEVSRWNPESVICDPWADDVFPAYELGKRAVCGAGWHGLNSVHKA